MSQQIPPPSPKRLRKGFLIIGIVFLTLGFFFVYWASRLNWDYVTTYKETVDLALPEHMSDYGFGYSFTFQTYGGVIEMQPNDYLTVGCPSPVSDGQTTLTVYKVLFGSTSRFQWDRYSKDEVLEYETGLVSYTNYQSNEFVDVNLAIPVNQVPNPNNVTILINAAVSTTITLHHYEKPQWVYLGIGVALSSLAVIPIFKSKK